MSSRHTKDLSMTTLQDPILIKEQSLPSCDLKSFPERQLTEACLD